MDSQSLLVTFINEGLQVVEISGSVDEFIATVGPAVHPGLSLGMGGLEEHASIGGTHIHHEVCETAVLEPGYVTDNVFLGVGKLFPVALTAYPNVGIVGPEAVGNVLSGIVSTPIYVRGGGSFGLVAGTNQSEC